MNVFNSTVIAVENQEMRSASDTVAIVVFAMVEEIPSKDAFGTRK